MLKTLQLHETKALTSNSQSTIQIPSYGVIQNLILRFSKASDVPATEAEIRAQIARVRLTFNGRDVVNCTIDELFDLYETLGNNVRDNIGVTGNIELNLARLFFNAPAVRDNFGFGCADISTIQVSVTPATITNIVSAQGITARTNDNRVLGAYGKFISYPQSFNSTGQHTVDTLPRDPDSAYMLVLASAGASGVISRGELRVNNATIIENLPIDTNELIVSNNRLVQPSGYFVYDINDGAEGSLLPMSGVTDLRFITTFTTAAGAAGYNLAALTINGLTYKK